MGFYAGLCTLWASQVTHALLVGATLCAAEGNLLVPGSKLGLLVLCPCRKATLDVYLAFPFQIISGNYFGF